MTVKELIAELSKFPEEMEIIDCCYSEIEDVKEVTWEDTNYPYTKPDKQVVQIS